MTPHVWTYPAQVLKVIDGDTIRLHLDLGLHIWRTENVRIAGIDTPELDTAAGRAARDAARQLLPVGFMVTFASRELDKYGRPLGGITHADFGDFASTMLTEGHATTYDGGKK